MFKLKSSAPQEQEPKNTTTMTDTPAPAAPLIPLKTSSSIGSNNQEAASKTTGNSASEKHRKLQQQLESLLKELQKREPLDPNYDALLPSQIRKNIKASLNVNKEKKEGSDGKKPNALSADVKLHRRLNANLRSVVETYASTPAGWKRRPNTRRIDVDFGVDKDSEKVSSAKNEEVESKVRAAFALRESKEHEQRDLVNATLKAENAKLRRGWGLSLITTATGGVGATGGQMFVAGMPPLEEASAKKKRLELVAKQLKDPEKGAAERIKMKKIAEKGRDVVSC